MQRRFMIGKALGGGTGPTIAETVGRRLPAWSRREWLLGLLLVLAVALAYQPVWHAGFIWDDDDHVTANPCIVGPLGLKDIWTTNNARYYPLVLTTFWIEHALWGLAPLPYHLVNVLMHGACAVALWRVLLSLRVPGAWLGAALWAVHPVQVETVAWITELKNTQSCLFYLLAILFFLRWLRAERTDSQGGARSYALSLLCAALAMASKSSTVVLPLVLGLCAWWVEGRWNRRTWVRVGPFFLLSAAASALAIWSVQLYGDVRDPQWTQTGPERLVTAGRVFWFYLGKIAWPHPLIFIYPRWVIEAGRCTSYLPLLAAIFVMTLVWLKRGAWGRPWFFALTYFLAALLPVLGLVEHFFLRYSFVADHLQYLAAMGPLALAGAGLARLGETVGPAQRWLPSGLCAGLLLVLGWLSWQRAWVYGNVDKLWADTLAQNPDCWMARNNLGLDFFEKGRTDEAMAQYRRALEIRPHYADAYYNLGLGYFQKGQVDEAIRQYQKALDVNPRHFKAQVNLGVAFFQKGQADEAIGHYRKALEINPDFALAHYHLGLALAQKGDVDETIAQFEAAVALDPGDARARYNLGLALFQKGRLEDAIEQDRTAVEIDPGFADAYNNLGLALFLAGRADDAIAPLQKALQINPGAAVAHYNLGDVRLRQGRFAEAIAQFRKAVEIDPNYADAHNNLGVALSQNGELAEAIGQFEEYVRLNPGDANAKANLAKAEAVLARQKAQGK